MAELVRIYTENPTSSGKRKGWWKVISSVDLRKRDGYAFGGNFLPEGYNDVAEGAVIVCQYPQGSVASPYKSGKLFVATKEGLEEVFSVTDWYKEFLLIRDKAKELLGGKTND